MNTLFQRFATRRNLFVLLIIVVIFNALFLLYFGNFKEPILDTYIYYSSAEAYDAIEGYGEFERQRYIKGTLMLDFALFRLQGSIRVAMFPLWILPIDYLENSVIIFLLSRFPKRHDILAGVAGILTLTKWSMVVICLLGILMLFFYRVFYKKGEVQ